MTCQKVRRSGCMTIAVPILLIASDCVGRVFSEETKTVIISLHEAGMLSRHKLVFRAGTGSPLSRIRIAKPKSVS